MNIKLLRDCLVGGQHCSKGEVVDVSDNDASYLISSKLAESASKGSKAKKTTVKKIRVVIRSVCMVGGNHVEPGESVSALEADAKVLLSHGLAFAAGSDEAKDFKVELKAQAAAKEKAEAEAQVEARCVAFADAVGQLKEGDADWTEDGKPDCNALKAAGVDVSADERDALWAEYQQLKA